MLELGGSDPFIVMPSADMRAAIDTAVKARVVNSGRSSIAAKRFIVAEAVADAFERGFTDRMRALEVGDPLDPATEVGRWRRGPCSRTSTIRWGARSRRGRAC